MPSGHRLPFLLIAMLLAAPVSAGSDFRLIPEPRSVTIVGGRLPLRGDITIAVASGESEDQFAAQLLRDEIENTCGTKARVVGGRSGTFVLTRDAGAAHFGDEGYEIEVKPSGVRAGARTAAGLFYAVQTLRQMIEPEGLLAATVEDRPTLRWRGIHDDISRGPAPTLETLKRRIRTAAEFKYNLYFLYLETAYAYRGHPLLSTSDAALNEPEVRELVAYALRYHIDLVPEQQTTGHLANVLRFERYAGIAEVPHGSTLAPGPESGAFLRSLYDELVPLFPGPFLHLGADEISEIGQGLTKAPVAASGLGPVYLRHLKALHDLMQPYGKRMLIWGDVCVDHPELVPGLPADLVIASWCYDVKSDYGPWIRPFRDARLDVFVCPGAANWNRVFPNLDIALQNIQGFIHEGQRAGAIGAIVCVWADNGDAPFDLNWYALAGGAAASWQEAPLDTARLRGAFDWAMFRKPGTDVADAVGLIQEGHRLIQGALHTEGNLSLFWQHPLSSAMDSQILAALEPVSAALRVSEENALERLAAARPNARHNAEVLDVYAFAARRFHSIGTRAMIASKVTVLYRRFLQKPAPGTRFLEARAPLDAINALLVEGRNDAVALRAEQERLWLRENRPTWIRNILALYDRDIQIWLNKLDTFRQCELLLRYGQKPPGPLEIGLAP